jgi:hypothetical protein
MQEPGEEGHHGIPDEEEAEAESDGADARQEVAEALVRLIGRVAIGESAVIDLAAPEEDERGKGEGEGAAAGAWRVIPATRTMALPRL